MVDESKEQLNLEIARLNLQIEQLTQKIDRLQHDKASLQALLATTAERSDAVEAEFKDRTEEMTRQSEVQFRLIAEATPLPILISTILDGKILYANTITTTTFGLPLAELLTCKTSDFYWNPQERQTLLTIFAQQGYVQNYELPLRRHDNSLLWVVLSLRPFMFNGDLTFLSALCDISDRKQAEDALRIAEATYRGIFENAIEGIFQSTSEGQYLKVNSSMARIYGYSSPEQMMARVTDIEQQIYVNRGDRQNFLHLMEEQGEVVDFEYQAYRADGRAIWVSESSRAIYNSLGCLVYYEGTNVDITRRKQQEEWLRQQLELLQFEIDPVEVEAQVTEILETDFFKQLYQEMRGDTAKTE